MATYIDGEKVAEAGKTLIPYHESEIVNQFDTSLKQTEDFLVQAEASKIHVIEALDGQLITHHTTEKATVQDGYVVSDTQRDILKMTVVNRYENAAPAMAFIKNFGLKEGAIASSVGHDSHNIIAVGVDDGSLCKAVNAIIEHRGGISAVSSQGTQVIPLPVAGIMTPVDGYQIAEDYIAIDALVKRMGSSLGSPFMTLSFMALLVIPDLKLSDKGLFDGKQFKFLDLCAGEALA